MVEDTEEKKEEEIVVEEEEDGDLFGLIVPLVFVFFTLTGGVLFLLLESPFPALIALGSGIIWLALSFRIVPPAFAGLVLRFGSRVKIGEDYLIKGEGWTLICPIVERIVKISLQQHEEVINKQRQNESDNDYKNRAESFTTSEGVSIFPALFCLYRVEYPGKVIELEGEIDENGISLTLTKMIHDFVLSGARGIMAKMKITEILNREVKEENGNSVPIGEKIKNEMILSPNFEKLGAEVLTIRLLDVKFTQEAQDVLDALEDIKKKDLSRQAQIIEADTKLEVQKKASETLVNKSNAELTEARNKALAKNADIAAFVGKNLGEEPTTPEDGEKYAKFQIGLKVAESLASSTKVIIPAGDVSKVMAGLVNVFEASKPDASK